MNNLTNKMRELTFFATPIVAGQVGQMLFGVGDTFVAAQYSSIVLAALGVATAIMAPILMIGVGITTVLSPLVSKLKAEGRPLSDFLWNSIIMSIVVGVILTIPLYGIFYFLPYFDLPAEMVVLIKKYLMICIPSIIPMLIYQACKEYLQAYGRTYFSNGLIIIFNIFNIILNYIFIFGYGPFLEMGIEGAGYATLLTRSIMAIIIIFYSFNRFSIDRSLNLQRWKEILHSGVPVGLSFLTEVLVFTLITVLIGRMGVMASASHNIVINLVSLTFMVPLALGSAISVKVGDALGRKDENDLRDFVWASLFLISGYMLLTATTYFLIPDVLMSIFTNDQEIISYGVGLLFYVALFQIPDGIQVTLWGALRGLGETKVPMIGSFILNWLIGIPLGLYLAYELNMEARGLWAGLAVGLSLMSIFLCYIIHRWPKKNHSLFS